MKIHPDERAILGTWAVVDGRVQADANCQRIEELTREYLHEVARDASGWDVLYIDPSDQRYWELIYPNSGAHGGGAPQLTCLSRDQVKSKYGPV